MQSQSTD